MSNRIEKDGCRFRIQRKLLKGTLTVSDEGQKKHLFGCTVMVLSNTDNLRPDFLLHPPETHEKP